ncbi:MAG TPA: hypothetical protein VJ869_09215 [Sphaerochaeta sp.]|nr:hypothetical protein [Sphaerochaeta sp.]
MLQTRPAIGGNIMATIKIVPRWLRSTHGRHGLWNLTLSAREDQL